MQQTPLVFICLAVGELYADDYVTRLYQMLERHVGRPFRFVCYSDRPRQFAAPIEQKDCSSWLTGNAALHPTYRKLRFFDAQSVPFEEFFYLDLTIVIRKDMRELIDYALDRPEGLVILKDWNYDCYNSSVMRIKRGKLQIVYDTFAQGKMYPYRIIGDQDFTFACIADQGYTDEVALFPADLVVSYKAVRNLNRTDPVAAKNRMEKAIIVKFHGRPKPHQLLDPFYNFFKIRLRHFRDASFWISELRHHWINTP